jgi:bacterioferritin
LADRYCLCQEERKKVQSKEIKTMNAVVEPVKEIVRRTEKAITDVKPAPPSARQVLIDGLNHDLAGEYQAILMYINYSAKLTGPFRRELRALFQTEVPDETGHAQFLSDKIASMGGEPTTEPRPVPHADQAHEMLEQALKAEKQAIADYTERIGQAEAMGDIGLKVNLENQLADESRHQEEIERILKGWSGRNLNESPMQDIGGQG